MKQMYHSKETCVFLINYHLIWCPIAESRTIEHTFIVRPLCGRLSTGSIFLLPAVNGGAKSSSID
jgi:hypothetical protein